jgi:SMODS-associated and fused to various effectors sensor domain
MPEKVDARERTKCIVWGSAAGRCTLCNRLVLENEDLGEPVPIGELAHNVGATIMSPRGTSGLGRDERAGPENLLLVCRNCHKPIDDGGQLGRWTVDQLRQKKQQHEERVRMLTGIGAENAAYVIRLIGPIRGSSPELSSDTVLIAATASGFYPKRLPEAHFADVDLDLRGAPEPTSEAQFVLQAGQVRDLAARVHDGVRREAIDRVAIFAFARIPLLVQLGASLDDKLDTRVFQRHRVDGGNAWLWQGNEAKLSLVINRLQQGTDRQHVALILSLSGSIGQADLPDQIDSSYTIYEVRPASDVPGPNLVASVGDLGVLEANLRDLFAIVEDNHGKVDSIAVFPAIGVATAVTLGRVLMPRVSPALVMHERDDDRRFYHALEVRR